MSQLPVFAAHVMPHAPFVQVAVAFGPLGHGAQRVPQLAGSMLDAHDVPHAWKSAPHVKPQAPFRHVAVELAGAAHGVHAAPQLFTLLFGTQSAPHR